MAERVPGAMTTLGLARGLPPADRNKPPLDVLLRLTFTPPLPARAALPYLSVSSTMMLPEAVPARSDCAGVWNTRAVGDPALIVSVWVAEKAPGTLAVMVSG